MIFIDGGQNFQSLGLEGTWMRQPFSEKRDYDFEAAAAYNEQQQQQQQQFA